MKTAINYKILGEYPGDMKKCLIMAKKHGFDAIECLPSEILDYGIQNTIDIINQTGIKISSCMMPFSPVDISEKEYEKKMIEFAEFVTAMGKTGVKLCTSFVRSSSDQYEFHDYYELHIKRWKPIAEMLRKYDIRLSLEFMGPKTSQKKKRYPFIRKADELLPLCRKIGNNVGMTFDFWHWYSGSNDKTVFEKINGVDYIYYVHLNDACEGNVDELLDKPRKLVGTSGVIDTCFLIGKLKEYNYQGYVLSESFDEKIKELPTLDDKMKAVKSSIDQAIK